MKRLLPIHPDVSSRLGVGRTTAFDLVKTGKLLSVTIGARRLVPESEVDRYIDELIEAAK
jgi:excisionase family DNA binding protein